MDKTSLNVKAEQAVTAALEEADRLDRRFVAPEHLLLALANQDGTVAARILAKHGLTHQSLLDELITETSVVDDEKEADRRRRQEEQDRRQEREQLAQEAAARAQQDREAAAARNKADRRPAAPVKEVEEVVADVLEKVAKGASVAAAFLRKP